MMQFTLITNPPLDYINQAWIFNDSYFTVDTAERKIVDTWYAKNAHHIIYAVQQDEVIGFFTVIPLTDDCTKQFDENTIIEEDITAHDMLPPETMREAKGLYVAAIAVKERTTLRGRQCVAALLAGFADRVLALYGPSLEKVFVNPTTFDGNRFIHRLGLRRVEGKKRALKAPNDIYYMPVNDETRVSLQRLKKHYGRFIGKTEWAS